MTLTCEELQIPELQTKGKRALSIDQK